MTTQPHDHRPEQTIDPTQSRRAAPRLTPTHLHIPAILTEKPLIPLARRRSARRGDRPELLECRVLLGREGHGGVPAWGRGGVATWYVVDVGDVGDVEAGTDGDGGRSREEVSDCPESG